MSWENRDGFPDTQDNHDRFWVFVMPNLHNAVEGMKYFLDREAAGKTDERERKFYRHAADSLERTIEKEKARLEAEIKQRKGAKKT